MSQKFPPGPGGLREVLSLRDPQHRLQTMLDLNHEYGDIVHANILGQHYYLLNHPEFTAQVLREKAHHFRSIPIGKHPDGSSYKPEVVAADNEFHREQRKLLQPAFTPARVAQYAGIMAQYAAELAHRLRVGGTVDLITVMNDLTLRIVARSLFDADIHESTDTFGTAVTLGSEYLAGEHRTPLLIPTGRNLKLIAAWQKMDKTIKEVIDTRLQSGEDKGDLLSAVLSALDEDTRFRLTAEQAHGVIMGLFIAGYETTANAMIWTLYLLGKHPEKLACLQNEIDSTLHEHLPSAESIEQLPYTLAVIRESMRVYPPVWNLARYVVSPVEIGGYTLPVKSAVFVSPYLSHHDARFFDHPERFEPERWLDGSDKRIPPFTYFPFGGGAHICLGQFFAMLEAQILLTVLIQATEVKLVDPHKEIAPRALITLRPSAPILARVGPR